MSSLLATTRPGGVATTHYRAFATPCSIAELLPVRAGASALEGTGDSEIIFDVRLEADGLSRRVYIDHPFDFGSLTASLGEDLPDEMGTTIRMDFFEYGQPVSIAISQGDDVIDFQDWLDDSGIDGLLS
jgi:hypothetical protein